jgi:hypothetical protein
MAVLQAPTPTSSLRRIIDAVRRELNWGPTVSPEFEERVIEQVNVDLIDLATENPHFFTSTEWEMPVETDFVCDASNEDDRVFRHDDDPFVLYREVVVGLDNWPINRLWDSRWIEITNEDGDKERRRIREVWFNKPQEGADQVYMSVDKALTITGDDLQFRVYTKQYPLPLNFMNLIGAGFRRRGHSLQVTVGGEHLVPYDIADPDERTSAGRMSDYPRNWWEGPPEEIRAPEGPIIAESASGQEPPTWDGEDVPGTFQYAAALGWGVWKEQSRADGNWAFRPTPRYLSALGESSGSASATAGGAAIRLVLPDIPWLEGWGGNSLDPAAPPDNVHWARNGLYWYIFRRRLASSVGNEPPHIIMSFHRHVPADGSWCLWRVEHSKVREVFDRGRWPPPLREFRPSFFRVHKTLIPGTIPATDGHLALRYHAYPDPLISDSDYARMTPGTEMALVYKVCANIAGQEGRPDTKRELLNQYYGTLAKNRSDAPVTSKVTKRTLPKVY